MRNRKQAENRQVGGLLRYRVLMVAPTSFFADYGCHVRILEEARILQGLGHEVTIVTYRNGRDLPGLNIERTLPIPWRRHYEVGSSRHKLVFDALLGGKTLALLARRRFDVIHAHLHEGALVALLLGRLFRIPFVFDFQGSLTEEMIDHGFLRRTGRLYRPVRRLEQWIDGHSPIIFTSSTNAESILMEQFQTDPGRIRALPDCVNTRTFRPAAGYARADLTELRQRLGVPEDARVIVYLGLLAEYQGIGLLLQAMRLLRARYSDVYLLLMGFPGVDHYQQVANDLGITDRVIFTGRVPYDHAPLHLALGDIAVGPKLSLTESAGKLLNYMAVGLPTVAYDTPVAREYLGANGVFAERGDVDSLATKLQELLDDPELGRRLGHNLRQRALLNFEWEQAALQILDAYDQLVGHSSRVDITSGAVIPRDSSRGV